MIKTKEELNQLRQEYESLNTKLKELNEDELKQVTGGLFANVSNDIPGLETIGPCVLGKSVNVNEVLTGVKNNQGNN